MKLVCRSALIKESPEGISAPAMLRAGPVAE